MEYVVLGLLMLRSQTIYELNQAFQQGISLFYSASYGSLQNALKKLLAKGWVTYHEEVEQGRLKKVYAISAEGQAAFLAWMASEADESKLEVTALSKLFFLGLIEEQSQKEQIVGDLIAKMDKAQQQLKDLEIALGDVTVPPQYASVMQYQLKTLEYGIQAHQFARTFFGSLLKEMRG